MLRISNMKLKPKMTMMFMGFGLIPALAILGVITYSQTQYEAEQSKQLLFSARAVSDMIETDMLKRYGDAQTFSAIASSSDFEKRKMASAVSMVRAMNNYMQSSKAYRLMMFLDLDGKPLAVNTKDSNGKLLETMHLTAMNFADKRWFKNVVNKDFTEGKNGFTGTVVADPAQNKLIADIYKDDGFVMPFSAAVKDMVGNTVGVWVNFVDFSVVEAPVAAFYEELKEKGNPASEITLMDSRGVVLVDYDPSNGKSIEAGRDFSVVGKFNLASKLAVAQKAVNQGFGVARSMHARKKVEQIAGFVHTRGSGNYSGMGWSVLVRVLPSEFLAVSNKVMYQVMGLIALFAGIVVLTGLWLGGRFSAPIRRAEASIKLLATGDLDATIEATQGADEVAGMFESLLVLQKGLQEQEVENKKAEMNSACLDGLANNVLMTDENDILTFTNQASIRNLTDLTDDIRKQFPDFDVNKLVGSSIHIFHKDPENIKRILRALQPGQQHRSIIDIGDLKLSLNAGGTFDSEGNRIGSYAEWRDVTADIAAKDKKEQMEKDINQVANMISDATRDISQGNLNLSERTEAQAASIEETTATMQQVTERVNDNAKNAEEALEMTAATRDAANKGGAVVKDAIHAMEEISSSSNKINDIISVIDEIAFQTNLLALNAAVEAARAGEQGRGFAVVASEVRTLAGRSATAAREIKDLITESVQKVDVGTRQVNETGECLDGIIMNVQNVDGMVSNISEASQEQAVSISEINKSVSQMDSFTQQNAALVEEAASASRSLEEQAANLVSAMNGEDVHEETTEAAKKVASKPNGGAVKASNGNAAVSCPVGASNGATTGGATADDGEWLEM